MYVCTITAGQYLWFIKHQFCNLDVVIPILEVRKISPAPFLVGQYLQGKVSYIFCEP